MTLKIEGRVLLFLTLLSLLSALPANNVFAQSTAFTYQGRLQDGGTSANGNYDFQFTLWDAVNGGTQQPQPAPVTVTKSNVVVTNGVFSTQLNFGSAAFPGADRFLETSVRLSGASNFTLLSPRQPITSTPYAVRSVSAGSADTAGSATNANQLGGVAANQYVVTSDSRLSDSRPPSAGSSNYIQNSTATQAGSNFNISGDGTSGGTLSANSINSTTTFKIGGNAVLSNGGSQNLFAGVGVGPSNTGTNNAFFGFNAGFSNTTGSNNAFFGRLAGGSNTVSNSNSFFGTQAGLLNTTGNNNSFFGRNSGVNNTSNSFNSYFGSLAGQNNDACCNSMFGFAAGDSTTAGQENSFFGYNAGLINATGNRNTAIGANADFGSGSLTNATAIGYRSLVNQDNSLVLGSISGVNGAVSNTKVGIGTTTPSEALHVVGNGLFTGNLTTNGTFSAPILSADTQFNLGSSRILAAPGPDILFMGAGAGQANTTGDIIAFFGNNAGHNNTTGTYNSFFGDTAGAGNISGSENSFFGAEAGFSNNTGGANSFFGSGAGFSNTTGSSNAFFGAGAGFFNVSANFNSFFGTDAGANNQTGSSNSFFGYRSGRANTAGPDNSFFGFTAGLNNTTGGENSFFGVGVGFKNNTGNQNAFFGKNAGANNTSGSSNSFFGTFAGIANTTADTNSFFGYASGNSNTTGAANSFFGFDVAFKNTTGTANSFFGATAGANNTTGNSNSFFGWNAGLNSTTGNGNSFFGYQAGLNNAMGQSNTAIGNDADLAANLTNSTAIGANAKVAASNSLVLGSINGVNNATADTNVGIGTTTPTARLQVNGITGLIGNVGIGTTSPAAKLEIRSGFDGQSAPQEAIRIVGPNSPADSGSAQDLRWSFASAGSSTIRAYRGSAWDTYLQFLTNAAGQGSDSPQVRMQIDHAGNIGIGTTAPQARLHVNGTIRMDVLGLPAGNSPLCLNVSNLIAFCNSSSLRYKTNVHSFYGGLNIINRLRPITFDWKEGSVPDLGLAAEEVNKVEPLLAFRNNKGEIEGVKYNQLSAVFINAFKEQQAQIESQQSLIQQEQKRTRDQQTMLETQQRQIEALKKLVCQKHRRAGVCR